MSIDKDNILPKGTMSPRPYARLLTMIGDQLIKNEKIALFELIKNSYDADADWVQVRLINFKETYDENNLLINIESQIDSIIEIEDDGIGMNWETLSDAWMNPAAPFKLLEKQKGNRKSEFKKRLIQGEKGIGRYAIFKIGSTVEITTKSIEKGSKELYLKSDLSVFDEETFKEKGGNKIKYLDEINYDYEIKPTPQYFIQRPDTDSKGIKKSYGTLLKISNLKERGLDLEKIDAIIEDVNKLSSPFTDTEEIASDFTFDLSVNGKSRYKKDEFKDRLTNLLDKAPLNILDGSYDNEVGFTFTQNGHKINLSFERIIPIKAFKDRFWNKKEKKLDRKPECGPFNFQFYVFDLAKDASPKYLFDNKDDDRDFIKSHRIYLYRDGVRVYPYGDPSDDWVELDKKRGTVRSGDFLSNDQVIGYIGISNELNPNLKDKTNREGLLEIGNSYDDFIALIQTILGYAHSEYEKYQKGKNDKVIFANFKQEKVVSQLDLFNLYLADKIDASKKKEFNDIITNYHAERKYLIDRAEIAEDLAAVGLTVESTSHDLMTMIHRSKETMDNLIRLSQANNVDSIKMREGLEQLRGSISFIEDQIKGIQPIFRSSRRKKKDFRISTIINNVRKYYEIVLENENIQLIIEEINPPLVIKTNEAVLLQTFINLFDNAVYWLETTDIENKTIHIKIDGQQYQVIFADNGPGISPADEPYIFESFFSTKGEKGRGLGLYIARQLLERNDFEIHYEKSNKILSGANFVIDFSADEET